MTIFTQLSHLLSRTLFIVASCIILNACSSDPGNGGIGGTGIGRITAFGSVYVNGVHYNTDGATFTFNDEASQQDELNLGSIVRVEGELNSDEATWTAKKVTYSDTIIGPVTQKANGRTIEIMKQSVITDDLTMLYGFTSLADLNSDNIVGVSGFRAADGTIKASSIRWISPSYISGITELRIEGFIDSDGTQSSSSDSIGGLTIDYPDEPGTGFRPLQSMPIADDSCLGANCIPVTDCIDGFDCEENDENTSKSTHREYVTITSTENLQEGTIKVTDIHPIDKTLPADNEFEIEGFVTRLISLQDFSVDGWPMFSSDQAIFNELTEGAYVRVSGESNEEGKLKVTKIIINEASNEVALKTTLQSLDIAEQTIQILGQPEYIDTSTIVSDNQITDNSTLSLEDFAVGDTALVVIRKDSRGHLTVARLSKIEGLTNTSMTGLPKAVDSDLATLTLFNQTIYTDGNTEYIGSDQSSLSQSAFFSIATKLQNKVLVTGQVRVDGIIDATILELSGSH